MPQSIRLHLWVALMWCGIVAAAVLQIATSLAVGWWISSTTLPLVSFTAGILAGSIAGVLQNRMFTARQTEFEDQVAGRPDHTGQFETVQRCLKKLCRIRKMAVPNVMLLRDAVPYGAERFTIIPGMKTKPLIVMHSRVPKELNERQLMALLAHELRHLCKVDLLCSQLTLSVFRVLRLYLPIVWLGGALVATSRIILGHDTQQALDGVVPLTVLLPAVVALCAGRLIGNGWLSRATEYRADALGVADLRRAGVGDELDFKEGLSWFNRMSPDLYEHLNWGWRLLLTHPTTKRRIRVLHWILQ